jgi:anhydro-N-acetylmuramic acid kinase
MQNTYKVIGLMSGTSLDGLDMASCTLATKGGFWTYSIEKSTTVKYDAYWKKKLGGAHKLLAEDLVALDAEFGHWMGEQVRAFVKKNKINKVDLVSSHGHTVFHQPEKKFTLQIGRGAALAAACGIKTVCDFRSGDVALGGQGAPLVPIGDKLLFSQYDACLNIGGIANISFSRATKRIAFDICPANIVLNHFANKKGYDYDKDGHLAMSGSVKWDLFKKLNKLGYYQNYASKSLGREWIEKHVISVLEKEKMGVNDKLATAAEHSAFQIARTFNQFKIKRVLITGGGAYNTDLISRTAAYCSTELDIPDHNTIQFKEALIFALLGVLRLRNEINCLKEVTGAKRDSVGGALYSV